VGGGAAAQPVVPAGLVAQPAGAAGAAGGPDRRGRAAAGPRPGTFAPPPDLDALGALEDHLSQGWPHAVEVLIDAAPADVERWLPRSLGQLAPDGEGRTRLRASTEDPDWYVRRMAALPAPFRILGSEPRVTGDADGILLGRTTYEMFAPAWSRRTADDDPGAPFFNDTVKYVVSSTLAGSTLAGSTLAEPVWQNSELIGGYDAARIAELKEKSATALYVSGSGTLVRALLADGLVDDLHLFVYPVTRSAGPRLFDESVAPATWRRAGIEAYDNGVTYLHLTPAG
jgi:dihydrofolate reductase